MEVVCTIKKGWLLRFCLCVALILFVCPAKAQKYTVRDGKQYISSAPGMNDASLESFIRQYELQDIGLRRFVRTGKRDSLLIAGWQVEQNNPSGFTISKPLFSVDNVSNAIDRITFTDKGEFAARFPVVSSGVRYGYNRFRNVLPFEVRHSTVRFFLRGHQKAQTVYLSGSFNDWSHDALRMTKTDEGWVARIPLKPGKYWYKFIIDGDWQLDEDNRLRENDGEGNTNSVYFRPNTVFTLVGHLDAKKVYLSGSFNEWREKELQMIKTPTGWELPIYLADGTHTYKYIVDGQWMEDERQKERAPDGTGGYNSVYRVGTPHLFSLKGFANAKQVVLAGSFNGWREDEWTLRRTATGWELPFTLGPGNYEYKFKIDGQWITDPANPLTAEHDGNTNSFLIIGANYTFRLKGYANARNIYLAGDFNSWSPNTLAMKHAGNEWVFPVHLSPGKHLYKFNVDGEWIIDPGNKLWEQNEYGTGNSVVWIGQ